MITQQAISSARGALVIVCCIAFALAASPTGRTDPLPCSVPGPGCPVPAAPNTTVPPPITAQPLVPTLVTPLTAPPITTVAPSTLVVPSTLVPTTYQSGSTTTVSSSELTTTTTTATTTEPITTVEPTTTTTEPTTTTLVPITTVTPTTIPTTTTTTTTETSTTTTTTTTTTASGALTVTTGPFTVTSDSTPRGVVRGTVLVTVVDDRSGSKGWTVTVAMSEFRGTKTALVASGRPTYTASSTDCSSSAGMAQLSESPAPAATASKRCSTSWTANVEIHTPADGLVADTYSATITHSIAPAPET
ncbi:hypothetical protein [Antrihabitans stalactiti]|uniref:hypothetical protein n=1 Tax=Antrihabitans stalactiti TaxID=2584121 RepID=UPI00197FD21D|nr:hypothetical protein [Antrihabitans stalactiti]